MSKRNKNRAIFRDKHGDLIMTPGELSQIHNEDVPVFDPVSLLRDGMEAMNLEDNVMKQKRLFKSDLYADLSTEIKKLPAGLAMEVEGRPGCGRRVKEKWYGDVKKQGRGGKYVLGSFEDDIEDWERLQDNLEHLRRVEDERRARARFQQSIMKERQDREKEIHEDTMRIAREKADRRASSRSEAKSAKAERKATKSESKKTAKSASKSKSTSKSAPGHEDIQRAFETLYRAGIMPRSGEESQDRSQARGQDRGQNRDQVRGQDRNREKTYDTFSGQKAFKGMKEGKYYGSSSESESESENDNDNDNGERYRTEPRYQSESRYYQADSRRNIPNNLNDGNEGSRGNRRR